MRQRRWIELFSDYDYEIRYHPGKANVKANVVADALSRKEIVKPKRVRAINMTLQSSIKDRILAAQTEAGKVRTLIMDEAHKSKYSVHPGADKIYYDLRDRYWWPGMKKDIAKKLEGIDMDFVTKLPRTSSGHDTIWVIVDQLSKSAHFLPMRKDYKMESVRPRLEDVGMSSSVVSFSYNNRYHYECEKWLLLLRHLYVESVRSPFMWAEFEGKIAENVIADKRRKPLEFSVGDYVLLKVSPWKGVVRFGKKGKLAPRFVGPFEIIKKVGHVAYQLDLPEKLNGVHDTFHEDLRENLEREFKKVGNEVGFTNVKVLFEFDETWPNSRGNENNQMKLK
ncbi:putative reverse transcriptase domain-containing protein [Tanacetum coccineum]